MGQAGTVSLTRFWFVGEHVNCSQRPNPPPCRCEATPLTAAPQFGGSCHGAFDVPAETGSEVRTLDRTGGFTAGVRSGSEPCRSTGLWYRAETLLPFLPEGGRLSSTPPRSSDGTRTEPDRTPQRLVNIPPPSVRWIRFFWEDSGSGPAELDRRTSG